MLATPESRFQSAPRGAFAWVPEEVPGLFCWTKMGVEAGQDLRSILRRKELERQAGDGVFVWGIGNSVGPTIREVVPNNRNLPVLFSPIQSKPRLIDVKPAALIVWLSYIDDRGDVCPLPRHALVTSRGDDPGTGGQKRHYALLCHSERSLLDEASDEVDFDELRNAATSKTLGFSQVTALVRRTPREVGGVAAKGRKYQVPFKAELFSPYCVRLADGASLPSSLIEEIVEVAKAANSTEWADFVQSIRALASATLTGTMPLFSMTAGA